jgi:outer membrane protein
MPQDTARFTGASRAARAIRGVRGDGAGAAAVAVLAIAAATGVRAESLADAIALAYQSNPTLQAQRATLRATDETYAQAKAGYEPTLSLQASVTTENNNEVSAVNSTQGVGAVQSSSAAINLTQPLYTGGRVASAVDAAEAGIRAGRETLRATEQSILQSVVQVYVGVRHDQLTLQIAEDSVVLLQRQLDEINARFKVGEITLTDVAQTRERVLAARAQRSTAESTLAVDRAAYAQVVGQFPGDLEPEPPLDDALPATIDKAFDGALAGNPQLLQATWTERGSAARLAQARAQTRPTLSLQGTASYAGGAAGVGSPFARIGHDFLASAVVTMPITTGGLTSSQIRQAVETNAADRQSIETARRQAMFSVSQSWRLLTGLRENVSIGQDAVKAAQTAFEGSRQEGKVGLRSTTDVLIAEQDLYSAEVNLADAERDKYVASAALLAATGNLNAKTFSAKVTPYDPVAHFHRISATPFWTPWEPAIAAADRVAAPPEGPAPGPLSKDH